MDGHSPEERGSQSACRIQPFNFGPAGLRSEPAPDLIRERTVENWLSKVANQVGTNSFRSVISTISSRSAVSSSRAARSANCPGACLGLGMVDERRVMVAAIRVSIGFMLLFVKPMGVSPGFRAKRLALRQICD